VGPLPRVKRPKCEADQSPPSSAEVNNVWICTSTPPLSPHGMVLIKLRMRIHGAVLS